MLIILFDVLIFHPPFHSFFLAHLLCMAFLIYPLTFVKARSIKNNVEMLRPSNKLTERQTQMHNWFREFIRPKTMIHKVGNLGKAGQGGWNRKETMDAESVI